MNETYVRESKTHERVVARKVKNMLTDSPRHVRCRRTAIPRRRQSEIGRRRLIRGKHCRRRLPRRIHRRRCLQVHRVNERQRHNPRRWSRQELRRRRIPPSNYVTASHSRFVNCGSARLFVQPTPAAKFQRRVNFRLLTCEVQLTDRPEWVSADGGGVCVEVNIPWSHVFFFLCVEEKTTQ